MSHQILVSTPDLRPSLLSILRGIAESGLLGRVATTLALSHRQVEMITNWPFLGPKLAKTIERRELPEFLIDKVDRIWLREFLRNATARLASPNAAHVVWEWAELNFDRVVARRYPGKFSVIYGMEHGSAETFAAQKNAGGRCLLRQVTAHAQTINATLRREIDRFPEFVTPYHRTLLASGKRIAERKQIEYHLADLIVANSAYVERTFRENGVPASKIISVPTGCPPVDLIGARSGRDRGKLRFLYVGTMSLRKGFPYLIQAWRQANVEAHAELWLAGTAEIDIQSLCLNGSSVRYFGSLNKDQLANVFREADVFVLPTLSEGLAHSILEALSFGLPIITTEESGASGFVLDGENGTIIPSADVVALTDAILSLIRNQSALPRMGARSRERAGHWTRDKSNMEHLKKLREFLTFKA